MFNNSTLFGTIFPLVKTAPRVREIATSKIFEYIEMFYNSKRRHSYLGFISPNKFEKRYNENVNNQ